MLKDKGGPQKYHRLNQPEIVLSQFWTLEVQDQGVDSVVSPEVSLLDVHTAAFLCPPIPLYPSILDVLCVLISFFFFPGCAASLLGLSFQTRD